MIAITQVRGEFHGIYELGKGYTSNEMKRKWDEFWQVKFRECEPIFWRYVEGNKLGRAGSLVSTYNAVYMHPMNFSAIFTCNGGCRQWSFGGGKSYLTYFASEISELDELCKACAKYCGARFELFTTKESEIEAPEDGFISYENEESYVRVMAVKTSEK